MRRVVSAGVALAALAVGPAARAQVEELEPYENISAGDLNWGHQAADAGYWTFLPVLALGINADAFREHRAAALSVEGAALLAAAVITPVVAAGAAAARRDAVTPVPGYRFFRVVGWVSYALMLIEAAVTYGLAFVMEVPAGLLSTTAILGSLSLLAMATDANASWRQARSSSPVVEGAPGGGRRRAAVTPWAAPVGADGRVTGGLIGLGLVR